jgi:hypothetical protein
MSRYFSSPVFFPIKQLILAPEILLFVINSPECSGPGCRFEFLRTFFKHDHYVVIRVDSPLMSTPGSLDFLVYLVPATELVYKRTCWCDVCTIVHPGADTSQRNSTKIGWKKLSCAIYCTWGCQDFPLYSSQGNLYNLVYVTPASFFVNQV